MQTRSAINVMEKLLLLRSDSCETNLIVLIRLSIKHFFKLIKTFHYL